MSLSNIRSSVLFLCRPDLELKNVSGLAIHYLWILVHLPVTVKKQVCKMLFSRKKIIPGFVFFKARYNYISEEKRPIKKEAVNFRTEPGLCANSKKQLLNKKKMIKSLQKALVNTTIDRKSFRGKRIVIAYAF